MTAYNPFFHRGAIRDRRYFFGRERETRQAVSMLHNGQSLSIVGQRRIGKTSLLFHVSDPAVLSDYGVDPGRFLFLYVDCSSLAHQDQEAIYRFLIDFMRSTLAAQGWSLPEPPPETTLYRTFEACLNQANGQDILPVFLLDEFEHLGLNQSLTPEFFSGLRALTSTTSMCCVTASKQPLLELTYADAGTLSSPFFNIFATQRLTLFSLQEAVDLLATLSALNGSPFTDQAIQTILEVAGPHPLLLHIAGYHACELDRAPTYRALRRLFYVEAEPHFQYFWNTLTETERYALATLPSSQSDLADVVRQLERQCVVYRDGDRYSHLSRAFQEFVHSQTVTGLHMSGRILIDHRRHQAQVAGQVIDLTPLQYDLLTCLLERAGSVATNEELERALWGDEYIDDPERLKSVIKGLRRVLGDQAEALENVRGVGYVWRPRHSP